MELSADAVLALAPDEASARAAKGLLGLSKWPTLGHDAHAVWGECQGSGSRPYQTQVDLAGTAFRCSCPSRKFPCKHGLALLLLRVQQAQAFTAGEPPAWVSEWLAGRRQQAERKEQKVAERAAAAAQPADPGAAAKRDAQRWKRIDAGVEELERWLGDLMRRGLGSVTREQVPDWQTMAARMVDAQAPGLGQRLQDAAALIGQGEGWPARLLERLGRLQLALDALRRRESLPAGVRADLQALLGWPVEREQVLASGERVHDTWQVLGQTTEERENRVTERRFWLQGRASGRHALLLEHAFAGKGFELAWVAGSACSATLAFYPGARPQRALVLDTPAAAAPQPWPAQTPAQAWDEVAAQLAATPWLPLQPLLFSQAQPWRRADGWWLQLAPGEALRLHLSERDGWQLLAASGGRPVTLFGEWDGETLNALSAWDAATGAPAVPLWVQRPGDPA